MMGIALPSLAVARNQREIVSKEAGEHSVLTEKQKKDLITTSQKYIAKDPQEAIKIVQLIDYRENNKCEFAEDVSGPLSIAILRDAGLLSVGADVSDFWLVDPVNKAEIFEQTFPQKMYERIDQKTSLQAGDFLYLYPKKADDSGQIVVVNRVDEKGRAYSVTNFKTESGFIIGEVILDDAGWTGSRDYTLWRLKDSTTVLPANRYESLGCEELHKDIEAIIDKSKGNWRILIQEIGGQTLYARRPDKVLVPASVIKISIAMDLLQLNKPLSEVVKGRSLDDLLHAMIVNSEEKATEILRNYLESLPNHSIEETLQSWGVWHTKTNPRYTTAEDTTILLRGLYQNSFLPPVARDKLLGYMAEYTEDDDKRIGVLRSVLPSDCHIYNKRGTLYENMLVIADAAIVEIPDKNNSSKKIYTMTFFGYRSPRGGEYQELETAIE